VRAAAKNHAWVGIVTSPDQYDEVAAEIEAGGLDEGLRRRLARAAFFSTAAYDAAIVGWFEKTDDGLPERIVLPLERTAELRYGENPHQAGAAYRSLGVPAWWESAEQLQGKAMSFNNYVDADSAWKHVHEYSGPACVIVKHTNACGVAVAEDLESAFRLAWEGDPLSAFGSVIAVNRPLDAATAEAMAAAGFIEVVVAPVIDDAGPLASKKNVRVISAPPPALAGLDLRVVDGGFVAQTWDSVTVDHEWTVVSARAPSPDEMRDLRFAWSVAAHTKSNAIVIARRGQAVGIGAGDQSRIGASESAPATRAGSAPPSGRSGRPAIVPKEAWPPATPSSRSRTAWKPWPRPGSLPLSSRVDRKAMRTSSLPPTSMEWRSCSPGTAISSTEDCSCVTERRYARLSHARMGQRREGNDRNTATERDNRGRHRQGRGRRTGDGSR
jgi:phosphoribosylaminoimidazolecarboxamide formyltransferase/IMP cyclohydrolase